jgi:hypothetical protein
MHTVPLEYEMGLPRVNGDSKDLILPPWEDIGMTKKNSAKRVVSPAGQMYTRL